MTFCGGVFDADGRRRRFEEIGALESHPDFWTQSQKATTLLKEKKQLELLLDPLKQVETALNDAEALLELCVEAGGLDEASSLELKSYVDSVESGMRGLELKKMLSGPMDGGDVYLVIHAGAGGTEACDWAGMLARMYSRYCVARGFKTSVIDSTDGDGAGYRSITFEVNGPFAYGYLKAENGIHRLVRISPFDSNARRHTSFASVYVHPIIEDDIEVEVRDEDLRIDTFRSSGAGGQHVNKTESAVRITHVPSGIVVKCQAERSQIQNRAKAMKMLKAMLYEKELEKRQAEVDKANAEKKAIAWGSQIRNYVLQPYQLIKDVRTGVQSSDVQRVLDGDLQAYIEAYLMKASDGTLNLGADAAADDL